MKVHLRCYGCQMNERDTEALAAALRERGHEIVEDEAQADALLFNTCSVRDQAERKAIGKIGIVKRLKREKPELIIGILGCVAQRLGGKLLETLPHADFVIGTDQTYRAPEVLESVAAERRKIVLDGPDDDAVHGLNKHLDDNAFFANVAIMRGCDMFCSYCIVPYVRGRERSRPPEEVEAEVRELAGKGVREILLLGQNVSAYGLNQREATLPTISPFADLLRRLDAIPGLARIRFTSPHPWFFNAPLVEAVTALPKVCDCVHLPLQSGSDRLLKQMNRRYDSAQYLALVRALRERRPSMTFSTDVIVGYPGETQEDFQATRDIMNEVGFDNAYIFKYSPREGTAAAELPDTVPTEVKEERDQILLADLAERTRRHNEALIGKTVEVLVEGASKRGPKRWMGRTTTHKAVMFDPTPDLAPGALANVIVRRATAMTLFGELAGRVG